MLLHIPEVTPDVLDQLEGHYVELSMQKYSSNVVEKCIAYAAEERHHRIIWELITSPEFHQIMQDPYGNYVIQAALNSSKVSSTPHKNSLKNLDSWRASDQLD